MAAPYYEGGDAASVLVAISAAGLRAQSSNLFAQSQNARVFGTATFEWDPASMAPDNGVSVLKPNDIAPANPGRWMRIAMGGGGGGSGGVPTRSDKGMNPLATVGNGAPTGLTVTDSPVGGSMVFVLVQGIEQSVGDGDKLHNCYFSADGGVTAKAISAIVAGDELYWNGLIALFDLVPSYELDFDYDIGSGLGGMIVVANIAALVALDDTGFASGTIVSMTSVMDEWILARDSAAAPDGITRVAPFSGLGNWERRSIPCLFWREQPAWQLNQAGGNDENAGAPGLPLASHEELLRRLGPEGPTVDTVVDIVGAYIGDLRIPYTTENAPSRAVTYRGERTLVHTGIFDAATMVYNPVIPDIGQVSDTVTPTVFAPFARLAMVQTNGPDIGTVGWIVQGLAVNTAQHSLFFDLTTFGAGVEPTAGTTFDIYDLNTVTGDFIVENARAAVFLYDLRLQASAGVYLQAGALLSCGCIVDASRPQVLGGNWYALGCQIVNGVVEHSGGVVYLIGGVLLDARFEVIREGILVVSEKTVGHIRGDLEAALGGRILVDDGVWYCASFMAAAATRAVLVSPGGEVYLKGLVWGRTNTNDYLVEVVDDGQLVYRAASLPFFTGAAIADSLIGGAAHPFAAWPVFNLMTGSRATIGVLP